MSTKTESLISGDILIVDDTKANLELLVEILRNAGYQVRPASSGELALRSIKAKLPALILSDIQMPGIDGYELCRRLKADKSTRDIPIIFITILDDERQKLEGFQAGGVDYITKPFNEEEVLVRVSTHFQLRQNQQNLESMNTQLTNEISERKQAEESLLKERDFAESLLNTAQAIILVLDVDGQIVRFNPYMEEISGYSLADVQGKDWFDTFVPVQNRVKIRDLFRKAVGDIQTEGNVSSIVIKNGSKREIEWYDKTLKDTDENVIGLLAVGLDITERKLAEKKLQETYAKHASMIENIGDVIGIVGSDGMTKYQSPNIERWFGWKPEDIIGTNGWDKMHPDDVEMIQKEFSKMLEKETTSKVEYRFKCKDGNYKWIQLTAVNRINDPSINGVLLNYHDISKRRLQEAELHKYRNHLEVLVEERNKEIEAFAHSIVHDMNAPLRAIEGYTKILLEDYTSKLDEEGKNIGKVIRKNSHNIGMLIRGLRIFVGIGQKSMTLVNLDMKSMVKSMYYEVTSSKERERIKLTIDDTPNIVGDSMMMKQVWTHLISNAIKFSAKKDKSVISVSCKEEKDVITYSIKDNGVGIDMKYHDDIFNLFRKLHVEREFEGHGVGLALIQRIIERHKGKVWAESEKDKGATFYFSLPKKIK